jgi:hypothetical protein
MRKLFAALAVTAAAVATGAGPTSADAAVKCSKWQLPSSTVVYQNNGYRFLLYHAGNGEYKVQNQSAAEVTIDSVTAKKVRFIITWPNGTAGVYRGTIDADGFVDGYSYDRRNTSSQADWYMSRLARCAVR